jgi:hypothetical protein
MRLPFFPVSGFQFAVEPKKQKEEDRSRFRDALRQNPIRLMPEIYDRDKLIQLIAYICSFQGFKGAAGDGNVALTMIGWHLGRTSMISRHAFLEFWLIPDVGQGCIGQFGDGGFGHAHLPVEP